MFEFIRNFSSSFKRKLLGAGSIFPIGMRYDGATMDKQRMLATYGKSVYVYACVRRIATKTGSITFKLSKITNSRGDKKELKVHPVIDLLYKPNPMDSKADLIERLETNLQLTGEAFLYKIRKGKNKNGQVIGLRNIRPDYVFPQYDEDGMIVGYKVTTSNGGTQKDVPVEDMIPFYFPSVLQTELGVGPLQAAAIRIDTEEFAGRYQRDFFLNSARPDAALKVPGPLTPLQKEELKSSWSAKHQGVGKSSQIALLSGGLEYQQISLSQREMDYIESMRFTRDDILVAFQVPKTIVAITDDVNYANAKEGMRSFMSETIKPEMSRITERLNEYLVIPDFGEEFELDYEDPTPEDRAAKVAEYKDALTSKWLVINEVRAMENRPPIDGGWDLFMPFSDQPVGTLNPGSGSTKTIGLSQDAIRKIERAQKADSREKQLDTFRGRPTLMAKLEFKEAFIRECRKAIDVKGITKDIMDEVHASRSELIKKNTEAKGTHKPLITDEKIKSGYYDLVNKNIDDNAAILNPKMTEEAMSQMDRFLKKLKASKSLELGMKKKDISVEDISDIFDIKTENDILSGFIYPYLQQFLEDAGQEQLDIIAPGMNYNFNDAAKRALEKRAEYFADKVNNTTLTNLTGTLAEGISTGEGIRDLSDRVQKVYDQFPDYRSEMIARTETTAANNEGFKSAFKQTNFVTGKEWIATRDSRTRDSHAAIDGETVGIDDTFSNRLQYPGDQNGAPEEVINCRCVLGSAF